MISRSSLAASATSCAAISSSSASTARSARSASPCHLRQKLHASIPVLPITLRLHPRPGIVAAKPASELLGSLRVRNLDRIQQLANRTANQRRRVLHRRRSQDRRRVEDLLRPTGDQPELGRELERTLEHEPLLAVEQQPGTKANQARRVKARVVDRQAKRDLPAQIETNCVHRPLIRQPLPVSEQQHLGEHARRNRRATVALRVTLGEILITDDPIAMLGKQRVNRVLRQQIRAPRRVEEALLPIRHRKHLSTSLKSAELQGNAMESGGRTRRFSYRTFSVVSGWDATRGRIPRPRVSVGR